VSGFLKNKAHRLALVALPAMLLTVSVAFAQQRPADTADDAAAAVQRPANAPAAQPGPARRGNNAEATRAFLGLGVAPDMVAAERGKPIYAQNCAACHGPDARGGIGPNLLYSSQVLDDDHGEKLVPFLKVGRPDKGMPSFAALPERDLTDITEFLHLQVENYANRGTYQNNNNVMVGDAKAGAAYFRKNCVECHSATGDLKGVGGRIRPLDLQRAMIFPSREDHPKRAIRATVTTAEGTAEGVVTKIDDFVIVLTSDDGTVRPFARGDGVAVALKDPLAWHKAFAYRLKDKEMTDLVTYLGGLK
jgi:mono/diheme cytochrome c family protein